MHLISFLKKDLTVSATNREQENTLVMSYELQLKNDRPNTGFIGSLLSWLTIYDLTDSIVWIITVI